MRRALLIGINEYEAFPNLRGAINDIEAMRGILTSRFGFRPDRIRMLQNEEATRKGMLAALEQITREADPEDVVYIHYSGHGSQVDDLNGDEADGRDETLVPHDGRTPGVPDITDDEIERILADLKSSAAVVVFDSCHSGTATRGGVVVTTRSVPPDTRVDLYRRPVPSGVRERGVAPLVGERYVLLTGAASHQSALDGPVGGQYHGLFSYALAKSLSSGDRISPRALLARIEQELEQIREELGLMGMPEPQLEAARDRLEEPLLPAPTDSEATEAGRRPWVKVRAGKNDTAVLENGVAFGALPGSVWAVYPPGETAFAPKKATATATVLETRNGDAVARLSRPVAEGARAVVLAAPPPARRVPIALVGLPAARQERLAEALRARIGDWVEMVPRGRFARFVVQCQASAEGGAASCDVYGSDGISKLASFRAATDSEYIDRLAPLLSRSATVADLLALDNPSPPFQFELALTGVSPQDSQPLGTRGVRVTANTRIPRFRMRKGGQPRTAENSLQLRVRSSAPCYLTIADVDSVGRVNLLFPNDHQRADFYPQGMLPAKTWALIPDTFASDNRAGFHWDLAPPAGSDTIRAFCSSSLGTAALLRAHLQGTSAGLAKATSRRSSAGIPPQSLTRLREGLVDAAARGVVTRPAGAEASPAQSSAPVAQGDWAAASVTFQLDE